ncbi:transcription cofactor vestigial-like protein 2b isoform X1 [Alosa alosa]|uniref:transcription cofactor vestigial-like protein 2b isoform X1 n=1 Tax=Alosa alosa TaxID=278164 RepID=UPI00201519AF|nr:transcription cofactor vestigial-like protein 2b isoform X1 [Alosa alosa]
MSCLDVMYPAYGHYTPYAPAASAFISSLPAPVGVRSPSPRTREFMESVGSSQCTDSTSGAAAASAPAAPLPQSSSSSSSYTAATSPADDGPKEKQESPEAEYLNSRCVLFTYYQGDISSVVDEHFSRALSSYMEGESKRRTADTGTASPINRRSFPPSFWDSNYPSASGRGHCDPGVSPYSMDPYAHSALHPGLPHPHAHGHAHPHPHAHGPSDSWSYSQSQAYGPPRALHELYSAPGLEAHYGPLLMPAVRPPPHLGPLPGHYEVGKLEHTPTWPGLLPGGGDVAQTLALNMDPGESDVPWRKTRAAAEAHHNSFIVAVRTNQAGFLYTY